ncbi:MAG: hypothetical protein EBU66_15120 [Bacteroidetes bacterium]|nr:hypothetical protein [Bacteroidota bacterium]
MSFKEAQGIWNPITKIRLTNTNLEDVGDYSQLITSKDNERKEDFMEHFADKNPGAVSNIFAGLGGIVAAFVIGGLLYWAFLKNINIFLGSIGIIMTLFGIFYLVLTMSVREALKPDVLKFYLIIDIILIVLGVGIGGVFFWKEFGNRPATSVPVTPSVVATITPQPSIATSQQPSVPVNTELPISKPV